MKRKIIIVIGLVLISLTFLTTKKTIFQEPVEGLDRNRNGVRDDIDAFIDEKFKSSPLLQKAFRQEARAMQQIILHPEVDAHAHQKEMARAGSCIHLIAPNLSYSDAMSLEDRMYNTRERLKIYMKYNASLSGSVLTTEYDDPCDFSLP